MGDARLAVIRDGIELPEDQARALWRAFSEHMDENPHDVDGFAKAHGFARVRAEHRRTRAVLLVSSRAASLPPPPPARSSARSRPTTKKAEPEVVVVRTSRAASKAAEKRR